GRANGREAVAEDRADGREAWLFAVKAARDFCFQLFDIGGVFRISHLLREFGELFSRKLTRARQFKRELDYPRLFLTRQLLDFFNDARGCHAPTILKCEVAFKSKDLNSF